MRHFFLIDPLEKLFIEYDTSLALASVLQKEGHEVYLLFEKDLFFCNSYSFPFKAHSFLGNFDLSLGQNTHFTLRDNCSLNWKKGDILHMRLDPPFDSRYLRILWMLKSLKKEGIRVVNDPEGIMIFNEKLYAYEQKESCPSFVGSSLLGFKEFLHEIKKKSFPALILKPLDLYQGKGVERFFFNAHTDQELEEIFEKKVLAAQGPIVAQPYMKEIEKGEIRSTYFSGKELASVRKFPVSGDFLANMMSTRARLELAELSKIQRTVCERVSAELLKYGVEWIAFDLLGDTVSEVNITCPGLVGESSRIHEKNLFEEMIKRAKW